MLKLSGIVLVICCLFASQEDEKFTYKEQPVLSWEDFKGVPDQNSIHHATANTGMGYSWSYNTSFGKLDLTYEVKSHFYPNVSWVKMDKADAALLAHEQLHFDISELHARMLRKTMASYVIRRNIRKDLKTIYENAEAKRRAMQTAYDTETNHSIDIIAQQQWELKVKAQLEAYDAFAE